MRKCSDEGNGLFTSQSCCEDPLGHPRLKGMANACLQNRAGGMVLGAAEGKAEM